MSTNTDMILNNIGYQLKRIADAIEENNIINKELSGYVNKEV